MQNNLSSFSLLYPTGQSKSHGQAKSQSGKDYTNIKWEKEWFFEDISVTVYNIKPTR